MSVSIEDIRQAAHLIRSRIIVTPCARSRTLSDITGADIFLKFENLHFTSSFKERGALVKLHSLSTDQCKQGVIAMSAGNHAFGLAYHANQMKIPTTIVMPRFTPNIKVALTRKMGARVILHGTQFDETAQHALDVAQKERLCLIHPFDDDKIIAGQGTVALEMLKQVPSLDALVVPIGGGGLIAGCAIAAKAINPQIRIIGVQTDVYPAAHALYKGQNATFGRATIAEGIAVKRPGKRTMPVIRKQVDDILVVDETAIEEAVLLLLEVEKTVVEGAGAVGLAAVCAHGRHFAGRKVGLVLSGGNIDLLILSSIIQRGLARSGRLARMIVAARDVPGSLAAITDMIAASEANIVEVSHQRAFSNQPIQVAEVEFVLQTRGKEHIEQLAEKLTDAGYNAHWEEDPGNDSG